MSLLFLWLSYYMSSRKISFRSLMLPLVFVQITPSFLWIFYWIWFFLLPLYWSVIRLIFLKKIKLQFTMVISFKCGLLKGENYYFSLWQRLLICNWESIGIRFLLPWALQYEKSVWNLVDFPCVSIKLNWIQIWDSIIISSPPLYTKCRLLSASRIFNLMNNLCPTWTSGRVSEGNFSVLEPNNLHILGVGHTSSIGTSLIPQWPWNGYTTL